MVAGQVAKKLTAMACVTVSGGRVPGTGQAGGNFAPTEDGIAAHAGRALTPEDLLPHLDMPLRQSVPAVIGRPGTSQAARRPKSQENAHA
jgi:hypothetical protein